MNRNHFYEYCSALEKVLSFGYRHGLATPYIEKQVSKSSYFQSIEDGGSPLVADSDLLSSLFPEVRVSLTDAPIYSQCAWAGEAYMRIQADTGLTLEAIFLYLPIEEMYRLYPLYHEMDFSQVVAYFQQLYSETSVLGKLLKKYGYSLAYVSNLTGISYNVLNSLKRRRRDISKLAAQSIIPLAKAFHVRVETIAEIKTISE